MTLIASLLHKFDFAIEFVKENLFLNGVTGPLTELGQSCRDWFEQKNFGSNNARANVARLCCGRLTMGPRGSLELLSKPELVSAVVRLFSFFFFFF